MSRTWARAWGIVAITALLAGGHAASASTLALPQQPLLALALLANGDDYDDYGDYDDGWRQSVRVAVPSRHARWNSAPVGSVRVYHRRFDPRWGWRSAPRHRVVYTYFRGDLWFLDPTTGWAYSVDRYGVVYTADPDRGWVYSLGPLTRWTADLLYFFDLYRFDRGYWYCSDYDYFVDEWESRGRRGYDSYDSAYSALWQWEPYFGSPAFVSHTISFTTVFITQVRSHHVYIERNPQYRREFVDTIGLAAVTATPPRMVSPRAVTTSAYWEARDLAAAGVRRPDRRDRDAGRARRGRESVQAGSVVDVRRSPAYVAEPGAPVPGFNAPFPNAGRGLGAQPRDGSERNSDRGGGGNRPGDAGIGVAERPADGRRGRADAPPQFSEPEFSAPEQSRQRGGREVRTPDFQPQMPAQRPDRSREAIERMQPSDPVREPREPRGGGAAQPLQTVPMTPVYEAPREQPKVDAPTRERGAQFERTPQAQPRARSEAPITPRFEAPPARQPRQPEPARAPEPVRESAPAPRPQREDDERPDRRGRDLGETRPR